MFKSFIITCVFVCISCSAFSQSDVELNAVKFYNDIGYVRRSNPTIDSSQQERLYLRLNQLINQSGIAETGFSTFFLQPILNIVSESETNTGIAPIYIVDAELFLSVNRVDINKNFSASFFSTSKSISGSGRSRKDAINNIVNKISIRDSILMRFVRNSKIKILEYFKQNCNDVISQADRAIKVKDYELAISLYFSVPYPAPCYDDAMEKSVAVYKIYKEDLCNAILPKLKSYVALAQNADTAQSRKYYDEMLKLIDNIDYSSDYCNGEVSNIISKIETRLNERQKREWEQIVQQSKSNAEVDKERAKALVEINKNYQPSPQTILLISD